jgi:ribosomal protein S18 acetylase RimI-like enzyme
MSISISSDKKKLQPSEVADLYVELGWGTPKEYSVARMKRSLENCDIVIFARNEDGELIGITRALTDYAIDTKILDMIIAPDYQRQGVGRMLMGEMERLSKGTAIYCETEKKNFGFLEKLSYKKRKSLTVFVKKD